MIAYDCDSDADRLIRRPDRISVGHSFRCFWGGDRLSQRRAWAQQAASYKSPLEVMPALCKHMALATEKSTVQGGLKKLDLSTNRAMRHHQFPRGSQIVPCRTKESKARAALSGGSLRDLY